MKTRLLILLFFSMSAIPLIYAQESKTFEIDEFIIITDNLHVEEIILDWDSPYLPEGEIILDEAINGTVTIQIPKNMPRTVNLDFGSTLAPINDQRTNIISESESACYYLVSFKFENNDHLKFGSASLAAGNWESITIENDSCDELYDGLRESESIPDSESLNKKWGELYLEYQLLKESFSDYPNNVTTIERMAEIDDETMRIATILSEREFTIDVPGMDVRNVTFDDPVEPDCGPDTFLNEMGVCQVIDDGCKPDAYGNIYDCVPQYDYWRILFSSPIAMLVVFGTVGLVTGIPIVLIYYFRRKRK